MASSAAFPSRSHCAVTGAPEVGSEEHQLLLHLVSLGALSLDKALLHEQSREQARHDSLTGLLGHRVFHEVLEQQIAAANLPIPAIAIAGITIGNVDEVSKTGIRAVAVSSAIIAADDVRAAADGFKRKLKQ